jgi:hypothetical protein
MYRIMRQYEDKGLVEVWQVWNEQDAPLNAQASVSLTPQIYQQMLRQVIPAMKAGDAEATVLTGGFTGSQMGDQYARQVIRGLPTDALPDGIAIHPYGRSVRPGRYATFGLLDEWLNAFLTVMPNRPLWITEYGILDLPNDNPTDIGNYALEYISHIRQRYAERIPAVIWYAWAEGMHNGYGLVDRNQNVRPGLTERFLNA